VFNRFAKVLLSFSVLIGMALTTVVAQTPPKERKVKDQAEYDLYNNSIKTTDPAKRLTFLNEWKEKYPESDFKDVRNLVFLATYRALNQPAKEIATANEILATDPKEPNALLSLTQLTRTFPQPPTSDSLAAGEKAAQALVEAPKPAMVADEETWKKARAAEAYSTLAFIALQKKQPEAAEDAYKKWLEADPNAAFASYSLGNTILGEKKVERYPEMLYHWARAASLTGPGALPEQMRKQAENSLIKGYTTFHGSDDAGLKELRTLAVAQPMPPAGFKILDKNEIAAANQAKAAADNPQLALWKNIKDQLTAANGEQYFNDQLKGTAPPKLRGKLVSTKPAIRPTQLLLDLEGGDTAEVTLKLETPLPGKADKGTEIQFEGVPSAFTKDPFMLTFDVASKDKIQGWPAQAPPAKKRPPVRKTQ
jgi:tetratricopeptide (TPR) repeat protein